MRFVSARISQALCFSLLGCGLFGTAVSAATPTQAPTQETGKHLEERRKHYEESLARWLDQHKIYSAEAKKQQVEGNAVIELTIDPSGKVLSHKILTPTNQPLIDDTLEETIRQAGHAPMPPKGLYPNVADRTFQVQIDYILR